jgi:hypothetical protein
MSTGQKSGTLRVVVVVVIVIVVVVAVVVVVVVVVVKAKAAVVVVAVVVVLLVYGNIKPPRWLLKPEIHFSLLRRLFHHKTISI